MQKLKCYACGLLFFAVACCLEAESAYSNLVLNSSFENSALSAGGVDNFNGDPIGQGWVVGDGAGGLLLFRPAIGDGRPAAPNGSQYIGSSLLPKTFFQDIPLLAASREYRVTFQLAAASPANAPGAVSVNILNGSSIFSQAFSSASPNFGLQQFTFTTTNAGTYRLQVTTGTFTPSYMDAFTLDVTAVPEPSSVLLVLGGSLLLFRRSRILRSRQPSC